jgi:hypothetical protein
MVKVRVMFRIRVRVHISSSVELWLEVVLGLG